MKACGVILAAGEGARLGAGGPKGFVPLGGKPLLAHSVATFRSCAAIAFTVVVHPAGVDPSDAIGPSGTPVVPVTGGVTRQASVRAALGAAADADVVVIHDAARPFVSTALIERALEGLEHADGAVCAVPASDTLKRVEGQYITETVERAGLWRAQTPQAFRTDVLRSAHELAVAEGFEATDDSQLVERYGGKVVIVQGHPGNIKVTDAADLALAEALARADDRRYGVGYDAHRLVDGRPLILGGVNVPSERGLAGHSDADIVAHAICDAVLGAAAFGDIGTHFPSSDERWRGASSVEFVRAAARMVRDAGYVVTSVDVTVILQRPAIKPYVEQMRAEMASALDADMDRVSIKATTTDELGHIGAGEGAAAVAIASLSPR